MNSQSAANRRAQRRANIAFDLLEPCAPRILQVTSPIFRETARGILEPIGSSVLLRIADEPLVLTSAHVLDDATAQTPLYVGTHNSTVLLQGRWFRSPLPKSGNRGDDRLDVGIARLSSTALASFDESCFLSPAELAPGQALTPGAIAVVCGYPHRKHRRTGHLEWESDAYTVSAMSAPLEDYARLDVQRSHAVVLGFDQKRSWTRQGQRTAPRLEGVSGGGVWVLRRPGGGDPPRPLLAAIFIEWHRGGKRVIATRIEVLLGGIWGYWPELRPFLP